MKKDNIWLTVIVPADGEEKGLVRAIGSILMQSFEDYEILLLTDERIEKLKRIEDLDERIRIVSIGDSLDIAGDYVTFMMPEDSYLDDDALGRIHDEALRCSADAVQFGHDDVDGSERDRISTSEFILTVTRDNFRENEYPQLLCGCWDGSHLTDRPWDKIYRRELLENLPEISSDSIMALYLLENCRVMSFLPDILYEHHEEEEVLSAEQCMDRMEELKMHQLRLLERGEFEEKDEIRNFIHADTAIWLEEFARFSGLMTAGKNLEDIVRYGMELSAVKEAKAYYEYECSEDWEEVELLRKGSPSEYLDAVIYQNEEGSCN